MAIGSSRRKNPTWMACANDRCYAIDTRWRDHMQNMQGCPALEKTSCFSKIRGFSWTKSQFYIWPNVTTGRGRVGTCQNVIVIDALNEEDKGTCRALWQFVAIESLASMFLVPEGSPHADQGNINLLWKYEVVHSLHPPVRTSPLWLIIPTHKIRHYHHISSISICMPWAYPVLVDIK